MNISKDLLAEELNNICCLTLKHESAKLVITEQTGKLAANRQVSGTTVMGLKVDGEKWMMRTV